MEICFEGIGQVVATFHTEDELTPGMAVTLKDGGTVGLGDGNSPLCGVTVGAARGGAVAVQIGGVAKAGCSGSAVPAVGYRKLACDSAGKLTQSESGGVTCLVLAVDADGDEKSVVIKL